MIAAVPLFLTAACTGAGSVTGAVPTGGPPVIVPGEPGQEARLASPGEQVLPPSPAGPNAADVRFVERMIPHHRQALELTALVAGRSTDADLRTLAERIAAAQRAEITAMASWLRRLGRRVPDGHGHFGADATPMPGMVTPEQLGRLRAARGAEFRRLFLELMIAHHRGAVAMAGEVLRGGQDRFVARLARSIADDQLIEIRRMRAMLGARP